MSLWRSGNWLDALVGLWRQGAWGKAALLGVTFLLLFVLIDGIRAWFQNTITRRVFDWFGAQLPGWLELVAVNALALIASLALVTAAALIGFILGERYRPQPLQALKPEQSAALGLDKVREICTRWCKLAEEIEGTECVGVVGYYYALTDRQKLELAEAAIEAERLGAAKEQDILDSVDSLEARVALIGAARRLCQNNDFNPDDLAPLPQVDGHTRRYE